MTKYLYLFGYPLGHSISPAMQNAALQERGILGVEYVKNPMPPEKMSDMLAAVRAADCLGANVTVPHKQTILPHLDQLTPLAREIGAVNTIYKRVAENGVETLVGDNTDEYGFIRALRVRHIHAKNARVVIFGAGGGAAAAAFALAREGAQEIVLLNRTLARAVELADRLNRSFPRLELGINDWDALEHMQLVINATAVGMTPHADASPLPPAYALPARAIVFDLVYNPPATKFLREAKARGARVIGGLEMLIYQGARAFELWTGARAPIPVMINAAANALLEMMQTHSETLTKGQSDEPRRAD
jgi:shikimate dehydrogenase